MGRGFDRFIRELVLYEVALDFLLMRNKSNSFTGTIFTQAVFLSILWKGSREQVSPAQAHQSAH